MVYFLKVVLGFLCFVLFFLIKGENLLLVSEFFRMFSFFISAELHMVASFRFVSS